MLPIRVAALNTYRNLSMALPIFKSMGHTAKVGAITAEIIPAVIPATAFLYEAASEQSNNQHDGLFNVLLAAGESYLNQGVIRKASDLFIYIPLASGAYEMGRAKGFREKSFELVRTAVLFSAAYFGMTNLGFGITNALQLSEAEQMVNAIKQIKPEGIKALPVHYQSIVKNLQSAAQNQKSLLDLYRTSPKHTVQEKSLDTAMVVLSNAQKKLMAVIPQIQETVLPKLSDAGRESLNHLLSLTRSYQAKYVKILRSLNPIFGYFITTAFIATPLIGAIKNVWLPDGESVERPGKLINPLWANNALSLLSGLNPLPPRRTDSLPLSQPF